MGDREPDRSKVRPPAQRLGLSSEDADPGSLLQSRLRLFHSVVFAMTGTLLAFSFVFVSKMSVLRFERSVLISLALHCVMVLVAGLSWRILRGRKLQVGALHALDTAVATLIGLLASGWLTLIPPQFRPDLGMLLAMTLILFGRAALVPSSTSRTLGVGAAVLIPLLIAVYVAFSQGATPAWLRPISTVVSLAVVWVILIIGLSALTSRVIYGLRRKVAQAMQLGQYTVERLLGRGGMGSVYLAHHSLLRRPTAIKVLDVETAGAEAIARFEREARATSQLTHPNTVAIYDYGRTPDGSFYYAMEYLDGFDLETLVLIDGAQPPARVVHILSQACGALAEAHARGLIHRDIKPANIMLCERGLEPDFVKVLDFGLVRADPNSSVRLSREQTVRGTPLYMAPESIVAPDEVDARADIYALGGVAYYLLSGRPPLDGKTAMDVMMKQVRDAPDPPSLRLGRRLHAGLEALVMQCLEKPVDLRPPSMASLRSALAALEIEPWTEGAATWWSERAPSVRAARAAAGASGSVSDAPRPAGDSPPPVTVLIDLGRRDAALAATEPGAAGREPAPG